jgi:glycosyltransferase involved in cell wall biosynthesis
MVNASGIGTTIRSRVPYLLAQRPDWQFTLLGDPAELAPLGWGAQPHVTIRSFTAPIYSLREQLAFQRLPARDYDLLWVPHINIPLLWPGRLLVTVHDVIFLAMPQFFGRLKVLVARLFFARIRQSADAIAFDSHFTAAEFDRLVGTPRGVAKVIYNGIDEAWFTPPDETIALPDWAAAPYIVCVGNLKPHKNLRTLIEAFAKLAPSVPHRLVVIGQRDGFITGDQDAERLGAALGDRIVFTGLLPFETLRLVVARAALLVLPSLYEGFGLTPLEALASGTLVAASRIGAVEEVCERSVLYFDPRDPEDIKNTIITCLGLPRIHSDKNHVLGFRGHDYHKLEMQIKSILQK